MVVLDIEMPENTFDCPFMEIELNYFENGIDLPYCYIRGDVLGQVELESLCKGLCTEGCPIKNDIKNN